MSIALLFQLLDTTRKALMCEREGTLFFFDFEAYFSKGDIRDILAVEDGKISSCEAGENRAEIPLDRPRFLGILREIRIERIDEAGRL